MYSGTAKNRGDSDQDCRGAEIFDNQIRRSMQSLLDFANHGILPFVGRTREAERLISFCAASPDAHSLRSAIVIGEAGVGKSRLFDEVLPQCENRGCIVLRAKLHPGSATSLLPLIAYALRLSTPARGLLRRELENESATAVLTALQRISRLRPTLLVVEDIHLLLGDSVGEFASLVAALADEPIALLCSARPLEIPARGILEPYLAAEIILGGLDDEALGTLWEKLFGPIDEKELLRRLRHTTTGNPLALRSALRSAVRTDEPPGGGGHVRLRFDRTRFVGSLERNIRLLSEGMAAHLNPAERKGAEALATLGEVFSHEAALPLLDGDAALITQLMFKGVITVSHTTAKRLTREPSAHPLLAFTHSLLHKHLSERGEFDANRGMRIVTDHLPLYSVLLFELLAKHAGAVTVSSETAAAAFIGLQYIHLELDYTADWHLAPIVAEAMTALMERSGIEWTRKELDESRLRFLLCRIRTLRRNFTSPEWEPLVGEFMRITDAPGLEMAKWRLTGLDFQHQLESYRNHPPEECIAGREAERLLKEYPELMEQESYLRYLSTYVHLLLNREDLEGMRAIKRTLDEIMAKPTTTTAYRDHALRNVYPFFIMVFDTEEELQDRLEILKRIETVGVRLNLTSPILKILLLETIGRFDEVAALCDDLALLMRDRTILSGLYQCYLIKHRSLIMLGADPDRAMAFLTDEYNAFPEHIRDSIVVDALPLVLILCGRPDLAAGIFTLFGERAGSDRIDYRLALATLAPDADEYLKEMYEEMAASDVPQAQLGAKVLDDRQEEAVEQAMGLLAGPMLRFTDALNYGITGRILLPMLPRIRSKELRGRLEGAITAAVTRALTWYADRGAFPCILPLLNDFGDLLPAGEPEVWRARARELAADRARRISGSTPAVDTRIRLTMLGRVEFRLPDRQVIPLRGLRMKAILGLLVADRLARKPLSKQEFYLLAAGDDARDFDLARKTVNMAIAAIRKLLPVDLILRHDDTISLDLDLLSVDLLDASAAVAEALAALRERSFARARSAVVTALDLAAGEVAFPSLYDTYFEAAREDFETRLRNAVVDVGRALLREGDTSGAEEVLERGYEWLPEDEEIGELLRNALVAADRRAEAERIRLRNQMEFA